MDARIVYHDVHVLTGVLCEPTFMFDSMVLDSIQIAFDGDAVEHG